MGESLQQREEGVTEELVRMQTKIALRDVTAEQMANVVIAYEPSGHRHRQDCDR